MKSYNRAYSECDMSDSEVMDLLSDNAANVLECSGISGPNFTQIARGKIDLNFNIIDQLQDEIESKLVDLS